VRTAAASGRYQAVAADQPYEDVLIDLKRRIWALLSSRYVGEHAILRHHQRSRLPVSGV
jgi:hypothetical protein